MGELLNLQSVLLAISNLVILCVALRYFFYKPVLKFMETRKKIYTEERAAIDEDRKIVTEEKRDYRRIVEGAQKEADQLTHRKMLEAEDRAQRIIQDAQEQAEQILRDAAKTLEEDRKRAEAQMREEVVSMAVSLSAKILEREVKAEDNRRIIDDFFKKVD